MSANIRKLVVQVDETRKEMGKTIEPPTRRAVAIAVIENPYAGRYSESLDELIAIGEELGALLGQKAVQALGIEPRQAPQALGRQNGRRDVVDVAGEVADPPLGIQQSGLLGPAPSMAQQAHRLTSPFVALAVR